MAPPPMRNAAVQAVGRMYFVVGLVGMAFAAVLAIVAISIGESSPLFHVMARG